jgi:Flp pilus assembly protein TadB
MDDRSKRDEPVSHTEPEIIPPGQSARSFRRGETRIWVSVGGQSGREVHIARPGLFSLIIALLLAGVAVAAVLAVLASILLIWIPVVALVLALLIGSGLVRGWWRSRRFTPHR